MDSDLPTQFPRPGEPFEFEGHQAALRAAERDRADRVLAPLGSLHPRPNINYYKDEAKKRQKARRASDPAAILTRTQDDLAREHGFRDWRKFSEGIRDRNARANAFHAAMRERNNQAVLAALESDPRPVVDVALTATHADLSYAANVPDSLSDAATSTLRIVGFALAMYGNPKTLAAQLDALHINDLDWVDASTLIEDRRAAAEADPNRQHEVEGFDEALSALAAYGVIDTDDGPLDMDP